MKTFFLKRISIIFIFFLTACSELEQNQYFSPNAQPHNDFTAIINRDITSIQTEISELLSQDFTIINISKEGNTTFGQINLAKPSLYVDCGVMNNEIYVDYIDRIFESSLKANLAMQLEEINQSTTNVLLDITYTFISIESGTTWEFSSNNPASIWVATPAEGALPQRECLSKHVLEESLISKIRNL
jgi:hypothetical protein